VPNAIPSACRHVLGESFFSKEQQPPPRPDEAASSLALRASSQLGGRAEAAQDRLAAGVAMDLENVPAVKLWPRPKSLRALRGFLGLTGYYRKFIAGYGEVEGPLTALLKEAFHWSDAAEAAFLQLKEALMTAPLLHMPDFSKRFIVDCDASGTGFGTVLHQGDGAIAFFSRAVAPHHQKLPAYERELIGLVKAVAIGDPIYGVGHLQYELIITV
jgi:hypothetical protein